MQKQTRHVCDVITINAAVRDETTFSRPLTVAQACSSGYPDRNQSSSRPRSLEC
jgi:hypothetical protein